MPRAILFSLLAGLAATGLVHAQEAIEGTVTDATGLVLPGVIVEARGTEPDGPIAITVTDGAGVFELSGLPPGMYDLTSTLPGFQRDVRRGVVRTLVPSFNVARHPISGAASLVRPASLRSLAHDHTLVCWSMGRREYALSHS